MREHLQRPRMADSGAKQDLPKVLQINDETFMVLSDDNKYIQYSGDKVKMSGYIMIEVSERMYKRFNENEILVVNVGKSEEKSTETPEKKEEGEPSEKSTETPEKKEEDEPLVKPVPVMAKGGAGGISYASAVTSDPTSSEKDELTNQEIYDKFIDALGKCRYIGGDDYTICWLTFVVYLKALIFNKTKMHREEFMKRGFLGMPSLWPIILENTGVSLNGNKSLTSMVRQLCDIDGFYLSRLKTEIAFWLARYSNMPCTKMDEEGHDKKMCTFCHNEVGDTTEFYGDSSHVLANIVADDREFRRMYSSVFGFEFLKKRENLKRMFNVISLTLTTMVDIPRPNKDIDIDFGCVSPEHFGMECHRLDGSYQKLNYEYDYDYPSNYDGEE